MSDHGEDIGPDDWKRHKPYGAGISRKRINFVKAGSAPVECPTTAPQPTTADVSSFYLNLVLGSKTAPGSPARDTKADATTIPICEACSLPITDPDTHQHSLAHQSSLPHSELPHHLDRSSQGLKYLVSRGWDPDAKIGLGKAGMEGERIPIAVKLNPKMDTAGLGIKVKDKRKGGDSIGREEGKVVKKRLDAKAARKEAERERERRKALADYLSRS